MNHEYNAGEVVKESEVPGQNNTPEEERMNDCGRDRRVDGNQ